MLYDLARKTENFDTDDANRTVIHLLQRAPDIAVFDIQNVADYLFLLDDDLPGDTFEAAFPNIAPPFDHFWMEFRPQWHVAESKVPLCDRPERIGVFFTTLSRASVNRTQKLRDAVADPNVVAHMFQDPDVEWILFCTAFFQIGGDTIGPMLTYLLTVDKNGKPLITEQPYGESVARGIPALPSRRMVQSAHELAAAEPDVDVQEFLKDIIMEIGKDAMTPCLLALTFIHCRGVTTREQEQQLTRQRRRLIERTGEKPPTRYHVLEIEPLKAAIAYATDGQKTGLTKALHICRGHFAVYGEDKPLFGHYVGTVWRPSHIRGRDSEHVVEKQYVIGEVSDSAGARGLAGAVKRRPKGREVPR